MPVTDQTLPPSPPTPVPLKFQGHSVAFELKRGRETEMLDLIIVDCLADQGDAVVHMVDGVRQHELHTGHGRAFIVRVEPLDDDPSIVRVVTTVYNPLALGVERIGWWLGLGLSAAFVAYMIVRLIDAPSVSGGVVFLTLLGAVAIFLTVLLLGWMARVALDKLLVTRGHHDAEAERIARDIFMALRQRAAPRPRG
jgi:multisubunit Na+/H+ antiporter MnhF subunit